MSGVAKGTYVYCLVAAREAPALKDVRGLSGLGRVRSLAIAEGGTSRRTGQGRTNRRTPLSQWLVVADAPLRLFGEEAINSRLSDLTWMSRAAIAHEAVVESFIDQPAVLPMKLFTIFLNDLRALEHVATERRRIAATLQRVADHHEWGVRMILDRKAVRGGHSKRVAKSGSPMSGAAYLSSKKADRDRTVELAERARDTVAAFYDELDDQASASKRKSPSELPARGGPLLLDAAFLVPRGRSDRFAKTVTREARILAERGYHVTLSGPWPPYSFVQG
jgi:hypothetical protein